MVNHGAGELMERQNGFKTRNV